MSMIVSLHWWTWIDRNGIFSVEGWYYMAHTSLVNYNDYFKLVCSLRAESYENVDTGKKSEIKVIASDIWHQK